MSGLVSGQRASLGGKKQAPGRQPESQKKPEREQSGLLLVPLWQIIAKVHHSYPSPDAVGQGGEEAILTTLPQWLVVIPFHPVSLL